MNYDDEEKFASQDILDLEIRVRRRYLETADMTVAECWVIEVQNYLVLKGWKKEDKDVSLKDSRK